MRFIYSALLTLILLVPVSLVAQDQTTIEPPQDFLQDLTNLKAKLDADQTLDESLKQQIAVLVKSAEASLEQTKTLGEWLTQNEQAADSAEQQAVAAKEELDKLNKTSMQSVDPATPVSKLETDTATLQREVRQTNEKLAAIETKIARRNDEIQKHVETAAALEERLTATKKAIQLLPADDGSLLADAKRVELRTKEKMIQVEETTVIAEQKRYEAEDAANLLRYQRDLEAARLERSQKQLDALQTVLNDKRRQNARELAKDAAEKESETIKEFPMLADSLQINTELANEVLATEDEAKKVIENRDKLIERLKELKTLQRETVDRVDAIGLSASVGAMLRRRRADLAEEAVAKVDTEQLVAQLQATQFEDFEREEERKRLDRKVIEKEIKAKFMERLRKDEIEKVDVLIGELVEARNEKLLALDDALNRKFRALMQSIEYEKRVKKTSAQFREYINERILWIRSNDVLFSEFKIDTSDMTLIDGGHWSNAASRIWGVIKRWRLVYCLSSLVILLMLMSKTRMRDEVDRLGMIAGKGSCVTFWPTIQALFWSLVIAITIPLIPLVLGLGIVWSRPTDNPLFDAFGSGFLAVAWFAFPMEILRRMCRPHGLANMHFDWTNKAVETLKRNLDWMTVPSALFVLVIVLLHNLDVTHRVDLVERIVFVAAMGVLGIFLYRTFNPTNGIFATHLAANDKSWANQTSFLWMGFILLVPLTLAVLTIWGYYYTALNLASYLYATFVFALIAETIHAMMRRLILLSRRRVHIQTARRKRELQIEAQKEAIKAREEVERVLAAAKAEAKFGDSEFDASTLPAPATTPIPSVESLIELRPSDDIDDNTIRATKLVGLVMMVVWAIGLWMIWTDVLPALKALDSVTLWPSNEVTTIVAEASSDPPKADNGGTAIGPSIEQPDSSSADTQTLATGSKNVTVRDLLKFIVISVLTLVSARNLPAAIEMLFLDHLPVDRSFRYATKALTSYAIIMLGMVLAFKTLSISWNNVQWLATALTFGLAFGLQEIFANFVAGIILMFERPIRIGDWITVDEFTGVVTRIRTRATTIVNWDRKEYVIPNKDFITGRLINWTLSDAINRVMINVGVAYGSDVLKAKKILLEVCSQHPKTVSDPPTAVSFEEFGDSSLNLVVRTFLSDVESRVPVIDDLHTQINQAFIEAGIEIPFPQRDLNVRSIDPVAADAVWNK